MSLDNEIQRRAQQPLARQTAQTAATPDPKEALRRQWQAHNKAVAEYEWVNTGILSLYSKLQEIARSYKQNIVRIDFGKPGIPPPFQSMLPKMDNTSSRGILKHAAFFIEDIDFPPRYYLGKGSMHDSGYLVYANRTGSFNVCRGYYKTRMDSSYVSAHPEKIVSWHSAREPSISKEFGNPPVLNWVEALDPHAHPGLKDPVQEHELRLNSEIHQNLTYNGVIDFYKNLIAEKMAARTAREHVAQKNTF